MSNAWYPTALEALANAGIDWPGDNAQIICLTGYTPNYATDQFVTDLGGTTLGTPTALTGKTVLAGGILDCDDVSYPGVALGETVEQVVVAMDTGSDATSQLLLFIDTASDTTPISRAGDGSNITIIIPSVSTRLAQV